MGLARGDGRAMSGVIDKIAWIHLDDGKILSTRSRGKDVYYLPGGKREPGETDLDTLVRESVRKSPSPLTLERLGSWVRFGPRRTAMRRASS